MTVVYIQNKNLKDKKQTTNLERFRKEKTLKEMLGRIYHRQGPHTANQQARHLCAYLCQTFQQHT